MKRIIITVSSLLIVLSLLTSCGRENVNEYKGTTARNTTSASEKTTNGADASEKDKTTDITDKSQITSRTGILSNTTDDADSDNKTGSQEESSNE